MKQLTEGDRSDPDSVGMRRKEVWDLWNQGKSVKDITRATGESAQFVYRALAARQKAAIAKRIGVSYGRKTS